MVEEPSQFSLNEITELASSTLPENVGKNVGDVVGAGVQNRIGSARTVDAPPISSSQQLSITMAPDNS